MLFYNLCIIKASVLSQKCILRFFCDNSLYMSYDKYQVSLKNIEEIEKNNLNILIKKENGIFVIDRAFLCALNNKNIGACPLPTKNITFKRIKNVKNGIVIKNNVGLCLTVQKDTQNMVFENCKSGSEKKKQVFIMLSPKEYKCEYDKIIKKEEESLSLEENSSSELQEKIPIDQTQVDFNLFFETAANKQE